MPKFDIARRYSLASFGEGWKDCYLEFSPVTIRELKGGLFDFTAFSEEELRKDPKLALKASEATSKMLEKHFIGGKAVVAGEIVDVKAADLEDFPVEVLGGALRFLLETTNQSVQTPSTPPSQPASKDAQ